jgi:hypothetical protein
MLNRQEDATGSSARLIRNAVAGVIVVSMLAACAAMPPRLASDERVAANRAIVRLSGTTTSGDVQNDLLRRAAAVTLQSGYTHFTLGGEDIASRTYYFPIGDTYLHGPDYGRRAGLWPEYPLVPETHYTGSAEVVMLRPDEAAGNPQAIDARSVP